MVVGFVGDEAGDAGAVAAVDVVFETGVGMSAVKVDFTGGDFEIAMDEIDEAVGEVAGEVRAEVSAILTEAASDVDAGELFVGEFDVGVGFVVAEEDIEAGPVLLDQVVFEQQRLGLGTRHRDLDVGQAGLHVRDARPHTLV